VRTRQVVLLGGVEPKRSLTRSFIDRIDGSTGAPLTFAVGGPLPHPACSDIGDIDGANECARSRGAAMGI
jgi:hypothetical protein